MKKKIRIFIYSRKSKYTDKGNSCGNQIDLAMEYIQIHYPENEYDVDSIVFEDEGFSGGTIDRPRFQEMLKLIRENKSDILICYRLDRISRNIADFSYLIKELSDHNVDFISIKEQFDTRTPMGRAMMYIASVFAQLEREVIAERIRDNLLELSKTGTWLGGNPPLGFSAERYQKVSICEKNNDNGISKKSKTASKLVINEKELKIYKLIVSKMLELKSLTKLETYLINHNIKTRKGAYYSIFSLKWILTNPVYAQNDKYMVKYFEEKGIHLYSEDDDRKLFNGKYGFLTYNKTSGKKDLPLEDWIVTVGLHPGIISGREWVAIQVLLEKNSDKRYRAADYPKKQSIVSGLIYCKQCGSYMRPRNMDKRRSDGTINYRYCCQLKEKSRGQKCNSKNVSGEKLDNKIIDIIKGTFVPNSEIYQELKKLSHGKDIKNSDEELQFLKNEYDKKQDEINSIIEKFKYIDIDLIDVINSNLRKLKEEKLELERQIEKIKKETQKVSNEKEIKTTKDLLKIINYSFKIFDLYDLKTKRDIANLFIESIYGDGENVEINFLNTKIDESQKKLFIPTSVKVVNFLDIDLPTDSRCKITFKK